MLVVATATCCAAFLQSTPHLKGTVLEQSSGIENPDLLWAEKMGVGNRCTYVAGDMFTEVPPAAPRADAEAV